MAQNAVTPQEEDRVTQGRTAMIGVRVTPSEKQDVQLVAAVERISESELMRPRVAEIVRRAAKIREGAVEETEAA